MTLLQRRRRMSPTAIGLKLLSFFKPACRRAPQRNGATEGGSFPAAIALMTLHSCVSALLDLFGAVAFSITIRCSGLKPETPGALPLWKVLAASETCWGVKNFGAASDSGITGSGLVGCFAFISRRAALLCSASPFETRAWSALVNWPSSPSLVALSTFFCWRLFSWGGGCFLFFLLLGLLLEMSTASCQRALWSPCPHLRSLSLMTWTL